LNNRPGRPMFKFKLILLPHEGAGVSQHEGAV
jgi:hypothetical protein